MADEEEGADVTDRAARPRRRFASIIVALTTLAFAAACSSAVDGHGAVSGTAANAATSSPDFPGSSSAAASSTATVPTSPVATSAAPSPGPAPPPTLAERERQLSAQTNGLAHVVVRVPGGYQAAVYDQRGHIAFWRNSASVATWQQIGRSTYPAAAQVGPPHASVLGALLSRMQNATFIVRGDFTGDSSGNAVAFTTGSAGWGAIKAEPNGNIGPSGHPVGADQIGLSYGFGFDHGALVTQDCPTDRAIADCGLHPITKRWLWTGTDFRLD
jgi:hypothetical protein